MIYFNRQKRKEIQNVLNRLIDLLQALTNSDSTNIIEIKQTIARVKRLKFRFKCYGPCAFFSLTILFTPATKLHDLAIEFDWVDEYNQLSKSLEQII